MLEARTVDLGDAHLSVYDAGSGQAILFLHGNAGRWQHWEPQLRALSIGFRCIAFDQRGYGASSPLMGSNSLSLMADAAAAVCRALGVGHAYVVGLSMGGAVAQALALRHPGLVAGLVLAAPPQLVVPPEGMPEISAELLRPMFAAGFSPAFQQRQPQLVARMISEYLETDLDTIRSYSTHDFDQIDPARIHAPALVIAGELDVLAPAEPLKQLAKILPNATYLELPGAGHVMNIEAPEEFTDAIVRFVAEHPPRR